MDPIENSLSDVLMHNDELDDPILWQEVAHSLAPGDEAVSQTASAKGKSAMLPAAVVPVPDLGTSSAAPVVQTNLTTVHASSTTSEGRRPRSRPRKSGGSTASRKRKAQSPQPAAASSDRNINGMTKEDEGSENTGNGGDDKPPLDEKELKKQRRLIRNRLSAQLHRERKRKLIESLEEQLRERDAEIADLRARERQLAHENAALRRALSSAAGGNVAGDRIDGCGTGSLSTHSVDSSSSSSSASSRSGSPDPTICSTTGFSASSSSSDTSSPPVSPPHAGGAESRYASRATLALMLPTMLVAAVFVSGKGLGVYHSTTNFAERAVVPSRPLGSHVTLRPATETAARRLVAAAASMNLTAATTIHNSSSSSRARSLLQVPRLRGGAKARNASATLRGQDREHNGTKRSSDASMRTIPIASTKPRPQSAIHSVSHGATAHDGYVLCPQAYGKFSLPPDADEERDLTEHHKARVGKRNTVSGGADGGSRSGGHEVAIYEGHKGDLPLSVYGRQHGNVVEDQPDTRPVMRHAIERPMLMPPARRGVTGKVAQLRNAEPPTASASAQSDSGFPFVAVYVPSSSIEGIGGLPSRAEGLHSNMKNTASTQKQDNQNQQQQTQPLWVELGCRVASARVLTGLQLESFAFASATATA